MGGTKNLPHEFSSILKTQVQYNANPSLQLYYTTKFLKLADAHKIEILGSAAVERYNRSCGASGHITGKKSLYGA